MKVTENKKNTNPTNNQSTATAAAQLTRIGLRCRVVDTRDEHGDRADVEGAGHAMSLIALAEHVGGHEAESRGNLVYVQGGYGKKKEKKKKKKRRVRDKEQK